MAQKASFSPQTELGSGDSGWITVVNCQDRLGATEKRTEENSTNETVRMLAGRGRAQQIRGGAEQLTVGAQTPVPLSPQTDTWLMRITKKFQQ